MKYYIIMPRFLERDIELEEKIKERDSEAVFVNRMSEADVCVIQHRWCYSPKCANDYAVAKCNKIKCREAREYFV